MKRSLWITWYPFFFSSRMGHFQFFVVGSMCWKGSQLHMSVQGEKEPSQPFPIGFGLVHPITRGTYVQLRIRLRMWRFSLTSRCIHQLIPAYLNSLATSLGIIVANIPKQPASPLEMWCFFIHVADWKCNKPLSSRMLSLFRNVRSQPAGTPIQTESSWRAACSFRVGWK